MDENELEQRDTLILKKMMMLMLFDVAADSLTKSLLDIT